MISESEVVPPNPPSAAEDLFTQVYDRLKAMASRRLAAGPRQTLNTTGLVHELYLRMAHEDGPRFAAQAQFFAYAARAMRHLLMDRARNRLRLRAGSDWVQVTLMASTPVSLNSAEEALALDQALAHLTPRSIPALHKSWNYVISGAFGAASGRGSQRVFAFGRARLAVCARLPA